MRKNNIRFIDAFFSLIKEKPVLSDYIVGIDAASIENDTEPWVFAPVFRHARSHKNVIPYSYDIGHNINNIGFTYHVGEDFRHIVSGLRHVDEVLTYFDYRSGDRLGHAIILGIDINDWIKHRNIVIIPIMEHLENLLWMWQYININFVKNIPKNLEFRIMEVAKKIYGNNLNGIDVYTLWRVYSSKFNLLEQKVVDKIKQENDCKLCKNINEIEWDFSTLLCSHYCPCFNEIYNKPIFVELKSDEISFYKELQDNLINKVEQMGIYIETNPSSNLIIGDISSILKHPILRLNNKGLNLPDMKETCVLTSINSDDPIVFSTFVENEISYIYYALLNEGCKREDVLNWINKIRKHGINSSFIKQKKTFYEMMDDFANILDLPKGK